MPQHNDETPGAARPVDVEAYVRGAIAWAEQETARDRAVAAEERRSVLAKQKSVAELLAAGVCLDVTPLARDATQESLGGRVDGRGIHAGGGFTIIRGFRVPILVTRQVAAILAMRDAHGLALRELLAAAYYATEREGWHQGLPKSAWAFNGPPPLFHLGEFRFQYIGTVEPTGELFGIIAVADEPSPAPRVTRWW